MTWTPQVRDLLAPLEDYTRLHTATVRRFGTRVLDLSFPNPRFLTDPHPYRVLADLAARSGPTDLRYSPFGGFTPVRRRVATALSRRHDLPYTWSNIIMTPGAAAALTVVLRTLFNPPDRIMLIRPCWMDYPLYLAQSGLGYDLVPATPDKHLDLDRIEEAWTDQTRGIILSQPASPTGVLYTAPELAALAALLHRMSHRLGQPPILIADEAHRDQIWAGTCLSPATAYPETITVHSFGKAWDMQGQRTGFIATSPYLTPALAAPDHLEQGMRLTGHCAPTALMQHLAAALSDRAPDTTALAEAQQRARHELDQLGVETLPAQATRFLYARCPTTDDLSFVATLAGRGVLTLPSTLFHEPGWFRLALNVPHAELSRGLAIIGQEATRA